MKLYCMLSVVSCCPECYWQDMSAAQGYQSVWVQDSDSCQTAELQCLLSLWDQHLVPYRALSLALDLCRCQAAVVQSATSHAMLQVFEESVIVALPSSHSSSRCTGSCASWGAFLHWSDLFFRQGLLVPRFACI